MILFALLTLRSRKNFKAGVNVSKTFADKKILEWGQNLRATKHRSKKIPSDILLLLLLL